MYLGMYSDFERKFPSISTTKIGASSLVMHTLVYEPTKLYVNYEVVFCLYCHPFLAVVTWPVSQPR